MSSDFNYKNNLFYGRKKLIVILVVGDMTNIKIFSDVSTDVILSSSDESILTIDSVGNVQAVSSGLLLLRQHMMVKQINLLLLLFILMM